MDPISIAVAGRIVGFFKPLVVKGAEELGRTVGVAAVDRIQDLLTTIRTRLAGDAPATSAIEDFEKDPETNEDRLRDVLADRIEKDAAFAAAVEDGIKAVGPRLVISLKAGTVVTQEGPDIGAIRSGRIDVTIEADKADTQKGGTYGDFG